MIAPDGLHLASPFKGARTYLHLCDLFDTTLSAFRPEDRVEMREITFSVHSMLERGGFILRGVGDGHMPAGAVARMSWRDAQGMAGLLALLPDPDSPAQAAAPRIPFDEAALIAPSRIDADARRICYDGPADRSSAAEFATVLNKALLIALYPDLGSSWLAVRQVFDRAPQGWSRIAVRLDTPAPARIYNSSIFLDDQKAGEISFMRRPK